MNKVFGYNSFGNTAFQGVMKLSARGPENLQRVVFFIDGETMAEDVEAPFEVRFDTSSYSIGDHNLTGTGYTTDGQELQASPLTVRFVTAGEGMQRALTLVIPLLVIVFGAMLLSFVVPVVLNRGKKLETPLGAERKYGVAGGTVCARCGRPFPMHLFAPNISPLHRLERCPYCGKFGLMRKRSIQELRAAESAELRMAGSNGPETTLSEEDKLRKELDESKFHTV
jgi:DNA-directed RNA polymerase subunit RPC12/RpoP